MQKTLTPQAQAVVADYNNLKIGNHQLPCPYFINISGVRASLPALVGKGTPAEIKEEAQIIAARKYLDLKKFNQPELTQFLINNNLGIDCSGFVYHVLEAELEGRDKGKLKHHLKWPTWKPWRKLINYLRPAENCGVKTLIFNSKLVKLNQLLPGDLVLATGAGLNQNRDHVFLVEKVVKNKEEVTKLELVHAIKFDNDHQFNHGIRRVMVTIYDPSKNILKQEWKEPAPTDLGKTLSYLQKAKQLKLMRIKALL